MNKRTVEYYVLAEFRGTRTLDRTRTVQVGGGARGEGCRVPSLPLPFHSAPPPPFQDNCDSLSPEDSCDSLSPEDNCDSLSPEDNCACGQFRSCLLYTSPSPRDCIVSRMPSSA